MILQLINSLMKISSSIISKNTIPYLNTTSQNLRQENKVGSLKKETYVMYYLIKPLVEIFLATEKKNSPKGRFIMKQMLITPAEIEIPTALSSPLMEKYG